jgi:hypothetical protein
MPIFSLDEPFRPAPKRNNRWYIDRNGERVIVFVHGVLSDSHGCWYRKPVETRPGVYWPDLLSKDPTFSAYSIYLGGYYTAPDSGPYEVRDCAAELFQGLDRREPEYPRAVLDRSSIVFVCHSMGGIVVRYMLTAQSWRFRDKEIGVALIASPSFGSVWADRLSLLIEYFQQEQSIELKWGNWSLEDLDYRFGLMVHDKGIRQLRGAEACENHFVIHSRWLPPMEPLVAADSAGRYFGPPRMLPNTDHFTCVKPGDRNHPGYLFLTDFFGHDLAKPAASPDQPGTRAVAAAPPSRGAPQSEGGPGMPVCRRLHWDITVDEEGDAYNEMEYAGIVLPPDAPNVYPLPLVEMQSGHTEPFELVRDARTSVSVWRLEAGAESAHRKIQMNVRFSNPPTALHPAGFCLRSYDWNAYSMHMQEYRQKPCWREDGLDYAEKTVPESWDVFTLLIRFPEQMIFAKAPFFEIYDRSGGAEKRNDELTAQYQDCFHYSKSLREALLLVRHPPAPYSYRVAWLLGESPLDSTSALTPAQRQRQRIFAQRLLALRDASGGVGDVPEGVHELQNTVNSVLASVAEYLQVCVGEQAALDATALEVSLMELDEDHPEAASPDGPKLPVLRIVAGTHLHLPEHRKLALFVGDGNAGRAWKRRMARVFDRIAKDPKRHIYVPISDSLRHSFLISVPLIDPQSSALVYGILYFGTFSEQQADVLRSLGETEQVLRITNYAQEYVLKRLLKELRM